MKKYKAASGAALAYLCLAVVSSQVQASPARPAAKPENIATSKPQLKVHFEKSAEAAAFWQWFSQHQPELSAMNGPDAPIFSELAKQFKKIDQGLVFDIQPLEGSKKEFAVSANSNLAYFPLAENVVAVAPQIKDWRIVAFRRRVPAAMLKEMSIAAQPAANGKIIAGAKTFGVAVKDMRFKLMPAGGRAKLVIYIKNYKADGPQAHMAEMVLQQAVGEYDSVKKIAEVKCEADKVPAAKDARPFVELPQALDKITGK